MAGKRVVIVFPWGVGDDKPCSMGAVGPALGKVHAFLFCIVGGPGGHDPQSIALDLLRQKPASIEGTAILPVAGQEQAAGQVIYRIRNLAK